MRKHVLQYDNVMNKHREIIYKRRQKILEKIEEGVDEGVRSKELGVSIEKTDLTPHPSPLTPSLSLHEDIVDSLRKEGRSIVLANAVGHDPEHWNITKIMEELSGLHPQLKELILEAKLKTIADQEQMATFVSDRLADFYELKCKQSGPELYVQAERVVTLRSIDTHWMDHIDDMSHLREQVAFAGYAQRDPVIEYQDQGFRRFQQLLAAIESEIVRMILQIDFAQFAPRLVLEQAQQDLAGISTNEAQIEGELNQTGVGALTQSPERVDESVLGSGGAFNDFLRMQQGKRSTPPLNEMKEREKVGRNDVCPCGSGKKFKKCHGKDA